MKNYKAFSDSWTGGINVPISKRVVITQDKQITECLNIDVDNNGNIKSRKGWKTFKGMIKELDRLNKNYKKHKLMGEFTIRLPIRGQK